MPGGAPNRLLDWARPSVKGREKATKIYVTRKKTVNLQMKPFACGEPV